MNDQPKPSSDRRLELLADRALAGLTDAEQAELLSASLPGISAADDEAWELAKFLTSREQLLEDGLEAEAIETAPLPVLHDPAFDDHFRADLLMVTRATRAIASFDMVLCAKGTPASAAAPPPAANPHAARIAR